MDTTGHADHSPALAYAEIDAHGAALEAAAARRPPLPEHVKRAVWNRDRGVCAACGCDTRKLARVLTWAEQHVRALGGNGYAARRELLDALGFETDVARRMWDYHHLIEWKNGGKHRAANVATLCRACHAPLRAAPDRAAALARNKAERLGRAGAALGARLAAKPRGREVWDQPAVE